ncbi:MAG TPA: CHAT domain-containing protein [Pyrinomonadaceae bacterium]|nr:CHAT domain-containing protein [Pyrinomonadaceae bacterium]
MRFYKYFAPMALLLFAIVFATHPFVPVSADRLALGVTQQQGDPSSSLSRGRALLKQGHADQALGYLQTALGLYTQANNQRGMAAAHDALGDLYLVQGQYKIALDHYQKAFEAFTAAAGKDQKTEAVTTGVASKASATTGAAAETAASTADNGFNANLMLAKIGDTNFRLGQLANAGAAYARMSVKKPESAVAKTTRRFGGLGGIVGSISTGRVDVAAPTSTAIGLLEAKKELDEYRVAIVYMTYELGMGRIAFANNDLPTAKKHFENALSAGSGALPVVAKLGQTRRFRTAARTSLGDVALKEGRYKDAAKLFDDAADGAKDDKRLDLMWPAQRGRGRSLWLQATQEKDNNKAMKLRDQALSSYREALQTIETVRAGSLRADESRTTFLASTKDVYDEAVSAFAEMALTTAAGAALSAKSLDYAAEALRISEEGRARSLLDMLAEVNAQITEGVPADLLKRKQDNLDRQQEIAAQLTGVSFAADQKKKPSDLEKELEKLQTDFDELENQIRTASPRYASLTAAEPSSLADIQQKVLDEKTVLLEYALGNDASYLFAVTPAGISLFKLPPKTDVNKLATDFRAQLIPPKLQRRLVGIDVAEEQRGLGLSQGPSENVDAFAAASNALYKAVIEPVANLIGDKRLVIVADGALNYVPFEALVKAPGGADYTSLDYLIKSNEVVYAPSASVIAAIRSSSAPAASANSILVVADPIFNPDDSRLKGIRVAETSGESRGLGLALESAVTDVAGTGEAASPSGRLRLARLLGTRAEAEAIANIARAEGAKSDTWIDLGASEERIDGAETANYRIVHIATHGLLDVERPQFTGVVLSLVGNTTADGFLRTDEIFNLKMRPALVMLSACETGLGKEKRGEGVIGLTRAFMYAGAPTVGVSLWSVADKSTAELMTDFYKRLLSPDTRPPAAAMRDAQLAMIAGKKYSAPFYWAPFVLVGEWK